MSLSVPAASSWARGEPCCGAQVTGLDLNDEASRRWRGSGSASLPASGAPLPASSLEVRAGGDMEPLRRLGEPPGFSGAAAWGTGSNGNTASLDAEETVRVDPLPHGSADAVSFAGVAVGNLHDQQHKWMQAEAQSGAKRRTAGNGFRLGGSNNVDPQKKQKLPSVLAPSRRHCLAEPAQGLHPL